MTEDEAGKPTIIIEPTMLGGVWANAVEFAPSPHEFTLDFVRMDYALGDPRRRGIVVARVAVSPLFVLRLIELLEAKWGSTLRARRQGRCGVAKRMNLKVVAPGTILPYELPANALGSETVKVPSAT